MILPKLLRHTRNRCRVSQMELALRLGVSQRHVSYLESARARPSRELLLAWMREVDAPPSIRNAALIQAGFAVRPGDTGLGNPARGAARLALEQVLSAHDPFPALVFDVDRIMVDVNRGGQWLWSVLMPEYLASAAGKAAHIDMIDALIHPGGLFRRRRDPGAAGAIFLGLLRAEEWLRPSLRERADALAQALTQRFGSMPDEHPREPGRPALNFVFDTEYGPWSFIIIQSLFGLPQDIAVDTLRIELWFPADGATRAAVLARAPSQA